MADNRHALQPTPVPCGAVLEADRKIAELRKALQDEQDARRWDAELIRTMEATCAAYHQKIQALEGRLALGATASAA